MKSALICFTGLIMCGCNHLAQPATSPPATQPTMTVFPTLEEAAIAAWDFDTDLPSEQHPGPGAGMIDRSATLRFMKTKAYKIEADLDGDGIDEVLLANGHFVGKDGKETTFDGAHNETWAILQKVADGWRIVGSGVGCPCPPYVLEESKNGWKSLLSGYHLSVGSGSSYLYEFDGKRYRRTKQTSYGYFGPGIDTSVMPLTATTLPSEEQAVMTLKSGSLYIETNGPEDLASVTYQWCFLPAGSDKWVALEEIEGNSHIDLGSITVSADEKYLAMLTGAGDPPTVEVVDLPAFLKDRKIKVIHTLTTYPGGGKLRGWKDGKLLISSRMNLTGKGPSYMSFSQPQVFSFETATGRVEAVSDDARNPARAMLRRVQAGDWDDEYAYGGNSLDAIVYLKAVEYRDDLRNLAAGEPNAEHKAQLLAAAGKLDEIASNPVAASRPATQPVGRAMPAK